METILEKPPKLTTKTRQRPKLPPNLNQRENMKYFEILGNEAQTEDKRPILSHKDRCVLLLLSKIPLFLYSSQYKTLPDFTNSYTTFIMRRVKTKSLNSNIKTPTRNICNAFLPAQLY